LLVSKSIDLPFLYIYFPLVSGLEEGGGSGFEGDADQLAKLVAEHQSRSKSAALEAEDLRQRLAEAEGDNRALRWCGGQRRRRQLEGIRGLAWLEGGREKYVN
jgi:hypothetical protein